MKLLNYLSVVLLLSATAVAAGPIYTWQDQEGRVYFSDTPQNDQGPISKTDLNTQMPVTANKTENEYSIRNQMEYFDQRRETQRQAWLERQRLKQAARAQELQARQLEQQAEQAAQTPQTVVINQRPYFRPYYRHPHYRQRTGIQSTSPYALQYLHRGDHHRFSLSTGSPYPSMPLNFWKY